MSGNRRRQVVALLSSLGVMASLAAVVVATKAAVPQREEPPIAFLSEAPDTATAMAAAQRQKTPVTVAELTNEHRLVKAQPDGSLQAQVSIVPMRVRQGKGWAEVDTTLASTSDGAIAPRVVEHELRFSGGGRHTPLVSYGPKGKRMTLTWPGVLPQPVLAGDKATYPEVFPGVDLVMQATATGYSQLFVVKSRQAALGELRMGVAVDGIRLKVAKDGSLEALKGKKERVFLAPPSLMWDSAEVKRQAAVGLTLKGKSLVLTPDRKMLADPSVTYPVTIDPSPAAWRSAWGQIYSAEPGAAYVNKTKSPEGHFQVGLCNWSGCGNPNMVGKARLYLQYDTRFLSGKVVTNVKLDLATAASPDCSGRTHALYLSHGQLSGSTTWNNPGGWSHISNFTAPSDCGHTGVGIEAGTTVRSGDWTTYIVAADETDKLAWRRYNPNVSTLTVTYNTAPGEPQELSTNPQRSVCTHCGGAQWLSDDFVELRARLSDPDGDWLVPHWNITGIGDVTGGGKGSGELFGYTLDLTKRADESRVDWKIKPKDWNDFGPEKSGPSFFVDRTPVTTAPTVDGGLYRPDNRWHGGIGVPSTFTFGSAGVKDIAYYGYWWDNSEPAYVDAASLGGSATKVISPDGDGPRTLHVQSYDRAGRPSPTTDYRVYVKPGNGPLAQWSFEGNTNDSAHVGYRTGTLAGTTSYVTGTVGSALELDSVSKASMTAENTLRTDNSFTVAAWVKVRKNLSGNQLIISQDGSGASGFHLGYFSGEGGYRWAFAMPNSTGGTDWAVSTPDAELGVWTHVTGVYDAQAGKLRVYVDGALAGETNRTGTPMRADGPLRIGQGIWNGLPAVGHFDGALDEVAVHDRALSAVEIRAGVTRDNVQAGHWRADDPATSRTVVNAVPGGQSGILNGGVTLGASGAAGTAMTFDGVSGEMVTSAPVVRTDRSYTVSAFVTPSRLAEAGTAMTLISQDGASTSGFFLQQRGNNWMFGFIKSDGSWAGWADTASGTAVAGERVHLTAVYNAATKQAQIYLNGMPGRSGAISYVSHAAGPFVVGRAQYGGQPVDRFAGVIDEVRAYTRALTDAEVRGVFVASNVAAGQWRLDGDLTDSSGLSKHATANGDVEYTAGQTSVPNPADNALRLNGGNAHATAPHLLDTGRSFSVQAWARLDAIGGHPAVVTQDGSRVSGFQLQNTPSGRWAFSMFSGDADGGGAEHYRIYGPLAQVGAWTHLAATYDEGTRRMELYVNGVLAASGTRGGTPWNAAGGLVIGAGKWDGNRVDHFPGSIDDVSAYQRVLFAEEVQIASGRDLSLVHHWAFDEGTGTVAADAAGSRAATLKGGAGRTAGRSGNALNVDGADDEATTSGIDLPTDRNFTVSTWVKLRSVECEDLYTGCRRVAVSADDAEQSRFRLGYFIDDTNAKGLWTFDLLEPTSGEIVGSAAVSTRNEDFDTWVHLAGTYDPVTKTILLYVDGVRIGEGLAGTNWKATGGVAIGRGKIGGAAAEYWPGTIDDVRLYAGTLDHQRISALFRSYPAASATAPLPTDALAEWKLDNNGDDATGHGNTLTIHNGQGWLGGRRGSSPKFDGATAYAQTAGPVLTTTESFSVTAWAYLNTATGNRAIVAQDGNRVSPFNLQYHASIKKWAVIVPKNDSDNPEPILLASAEMAKLAEWTHLGLVYQKESQQLRLYVNGVLSGVRVGVAPKASTGPFTVGRAKWLGANVDHFNWTVDEVRAYQRALTDGEIRAVHDDVPAANLGFYRFDDDAQDSSWRGNHATGTALTYETGVSGRAAKFNGSTSSASTQWLGTSTRDSFTVSAWARLDSKAKVATVVGQDGERTSGFVLQYRPGLDRWVFGAATQDADGLDPVYAASTSAAVTGEWVHLTGVYDYPGRQIKLYVNGYLAGVRNNTLLWPADRGLTIGRGKVNGGPGDYFTGAIDNVRVHTGIVKESEIVQLGFPAAPPGQLGRFVNPDGEHYLGSTNVKPKPGYRYEKAMGVAAGTRMLYECREPNRPNSTFTSSDPQCEGQAKVGEAGLVYAQKPTNVPVKALYRCRGAVERFDSDKADCEGVTVETLLGYSLGYVQLARYWDGQNHTTTIHGGPFNSVYEGPQGFLPVTAQSGTVTLMSCTDGWDQFLSTDALCEGKTVLAQLGEIFTSRPSGLDTKPISSCRMSNGERYIELDVTCVTGSPATLLGYTLIAPPAVTPVFGS